MLHLQFISFDGLFTINVYYDSFWIRDIPWILTLLDHGL